MAGLCEAAVSDDVGPALDGVHHRLVDTIGGGFVVARRVRRFWSEDEKRRIVAQTWAPGVSVSQVLTHCFCVTPQSYQYWAPNNIQNRGIGPSRRGR